MSDFMDFYLNKIVFRTVDNDDTIQTLKQIKQKKLYQETINVGDAVYKILLRNIKSDCRYRNILFNLDLETIKEITNKNCAYCNREPYEKRCAYQRKNSKAEDNCLLLNGLDRVIPEKGYVKDNVVPCCKYCNRAKSDLSLKEFKNLINLIYKNYINET